MDDNKVLTYPKLSLFLSEIKKLFAPKSHNHDDRYYTESEMNTKLEEKANSSTLTSHIANKALHIPSGGKSGQFLKWNSDGTTVWAADNNTTYASMTGATPTVAGKQGLVPAPTAGTSNRYLRSDGTWAIPPNTTYGEIPNEQIDNLFKNL